MLSPQDIDAVQPLPATNRTLTAEEIDSAPVDFSLPKSPVTLSPNALAAAQRPLMSGPTSTTAGGPPLHLNDSGGSPIEEFEQMDAPEGPAGIPQRAIQGGIAAVRTLGRAVGAGGNMLKATTGDVIEAPSQIAGYRQPFRNVRQYMQQAQPVAEIGGVQIGGGPQAQPGGKEKPLPIEEYYNQAGGVERFLGKATLALSEMEPRLAAGYALGAAGAPSAISAGLPMIVTDEGKLDPIGATVAAALPGVHGVGEEAVAKMLSKAPITKVIVQMLSKDGAMTLKGKITQELGGVRISNDAFRKFLESGGGFLAANAYLGTMQGAQHADEIAKMTPEQRAEFALDSVAQNIAPAILGFIKPGLSKTLEYKAPEIAPQMAEVAAEIRASNPPGAAKEPKPAKVTKVTTLTPKDIDAVQPQPGGANAVNPEQQQTGVQPKRGGTDEVGQTGPEAGAGNRVPGATGKPPEATPPSGTPPAAPAAGKEAVESQPSGGKTSTIQTLTPAIVTEDGQTLTGISHATIRQEASTKGIDAITNAKEGFADQDGNFVSRKDGAEWFEQKTGKQPAMPGELHSEDLRDAGLVSISSTSNEGAKVNMPTEKPTKTKGKTPKPTADSLEGWPKFITDYWTASKTDHGKGIPHGIATAFTEERLKLAGVTKDQMVKAINDAVARGVPEDFIINASKMTSTQLAYRDITQHAGKDQPPFQSPVNMNHLIMGIEVTPSETQEIGGVRYEIFRSAFPNKEPSAIIRVTDVDSGNVVSLNKFPTYDRAREEYDTTLNKVKKTEEKQPEVKAPAVNQNVEAGEKFNLAQWVADKLGKGESFKSPELFDAADKHFGGTQAEGKYTPKDAYDQMEAGVNRYIHKVGLTPNQSPGGAAHAVRLLKDIISKLPTQTARTKEMDAMQQFSTPPPLAYVANWVANIRPGEAMLEPSAGTGDLAVFAKNAGAIVIANELSERRLAVLKSTGIADHVLNLNAEHMHAFLEPLIRDGLPRPTVVVMNPPFSNAAKSGETKNTMIGAKHVEEALKVLAPGGRLVAIVGEGMASDKATFKDWWRRIQKSYDVLANIGVSGEEYRKYGTSFGNQLLVIDKPVGQPMGGQPVVGQVDKVEELIPLLEGVRNERRKLAAAEPSGADTDETGGAGAEPQPQPPATTGNLKPGGRKRPASGGANVLRPELAGTGVRAPAVKPGSPAGGRDQPAPAATPVGSPSDVAEAAAEGLTLEQLNAGRRELSEAGVFAEYHPVKVKIAGAMKHPTPLVEPTAMAAVDPPDPTYKPSIPKEVITSGGLSDAQIENVVYAGQAHERILPTGERMGFFIGDGTGVGKGREIAAIVMDNWNKGRKRAIWVSKTANLMNDAARDLRDLGFDIRKLIDMGSPTKAQKITEVKEGIAFVTYTGLAKNNPGVDPKSVGPGLTPSLNPTPEDKKSRMTLLREWLGKDFDGVIALDECHLAGNAVDLKSNRGIKRASERGKTIVDLQRILPKARIVYVSATGATDVTNFSYGDRLGIWGHGTPFPTKMAFFDAINAGGLSAMEIVARDLKSMGRYMSRTLSFEGVEQRQLAHKLTAPQTKIYNDASNAWQLVFSTVDEMMSQTGGNNSPRARSAVLAALFGAQQRFYNTLLTAMQMPTVIADMREQLAADNSIILQVVNTNEATLERELATKATEENMDLESLDLSPKDTLIQYVDNNFPTTKYEPVQDDQGNISWKPVVDEKGIPVADPAALEAKQELLDRLGSLAMPQNPLEMILDTFGYKNVAEVTGRSRRVVLEEQEGGTFKRVVQAKRGNSQRKVEADEFQEGKRRILIFSDAGGTGFSYHASRKVKNQQRRIHYLVQAGWKADAAIQGMGRSHRSDQAVAPFYVLPHTDIRGHQRFISTIARRLGELGALTSGERKATTRGLFDESNNLENSYAEDAVVRLFFDLYNNRVEGFKFDDVCKQMGYLKTIIDEHTGEPEVVNVLKDKQTGSLNVTKLPSIQQFLNRILAMTVENQNGFFDQFMARMVAAIENAKASGTFDPGVQTLKALEIRKVKDDVVYQHPDSTAVTRLVEVEHDHSNKANKWEDIAKISPHDQVIEFVKNNRSGTIFALKSGPNRTLESGEVVPTYRRISPASADIQPQRSIKPENFTQIPTDEAQKEWDRQVAAMPKIRTDKSTYVVGAFLPIWDRLKLPNPKIWRVTTNENETFLGALVPDDTVDALRSRLGAGAGSALTPEQAFDQILDSGVKVELSNGWILARTMRSGENRIEITNVEYGQGREITDYIGGYMERISYTPRYFISTDRAQGIASMEKIFAKAPPIEKQGSLGTLPSGISVPAAPYEARSVSELRTLLPLVGLDPQAERLLGAFLESPLAKLIEDVRTRVADTLDNGWQGSYFQGLVEIARDAHPVTGVHEMLHAVWDLLPADIKTELERMRVETINDMIADEGQSPNVGALKELIGSPTSGGEAFMAKGYSRDLYPVSSTEEFFTHSASSRFQQRVGSMQEGFWDRVKRLIADFIGAIKRALRLKPTQQEFLDSILRGDFKPANPEEVAASEAQASLAKERATDIAEGEEEARIPTKIFGERYYVFDREQITPESIAASSKVAKDMLDAAGIPAVEQSIPEDDLFPNRRAWLMPAQGRDMTAEGRKLLKALKREIGTKGGEPKTADRLANIINTIRINTFVLNNTAMHDMSPEVRLELGSIAQAEASFRGAALGALAGYRKDLTVVGRNLDIELGHIWSDAFGGDAIRRVMDELAAAKDRNEDLNKALDELLEREDRKLRRTMGSGSKVGKRMIELIRKGAGEPWELLREIAKSRGWTVPTDADLQKIKDLIDQAERIGNLTREEMAELGGDKSKIAAAADDKMMATQERRNVLMKQVRLGITRWTRPLNWSRYWQTPANNAAALNEYAIGNVLLKIGFAVRLPMHIMSQLLCVHVPSRAIGTALANARRLKAKKVDYSMFKLMHQALSDQAKASIASWNPAIRSFAAGLSGSDARNVDRLRSGVMLFERMEAKASEYAAKGDYGRAAAVWILHLPKFALRFIQAVDNFQGVPAEIAEMRHQARQFMREDLRSPAEIEAQMRAIFVGMGEKRDLALADAARYLQTAGIQYTRQQLAETAWNMVKGRMYREMETLGAPADDFRTRNAFLLRTMAWQQPADTGIGGLMAVGMKAIRATAASKGVPLPFLAFGNAIGTGVNYMLMNTPLYAAASWRIPGISHGPSPWFATESDRMQRRVQALLYTMIGAALIALVKAGLIKVWLHAPQDKVERTIWERQGHKVGTFEIRINENEVITWSLSVGPGALVSPYLASAGAWQDMEDRQAKRQAKMNEEAQKLGLQPGKVSAPDAADIATAAGAAAWGVMMGNKALSGVVQSGSEFGLPNATKMAASQVSPFALGLPGYQELTRAAGIVMDPKLATFADYLVPLPTSKGRAYNVLGDPVGTPDTDQRIIQTLTAGTYPWLVDKRQGVASAAYAALVNTGFRPPTIDPNRGYAIDGQFRPLTDPELERYTALRSQYLVEELSGVGAEATLGEVRAAYGEANQRALGAVGVDTPGTGSIIKSATPSVASAPRSTTGGQSHTPQSAPASGYKPLVSANNVIASPGVGVRQPASGHRKAAAGHALPRPRTVHSVLGLGHGHSKGIGRLPALRRR